MLCFFACCYHPQPPSAPAPLWDPFFLIHLSQDTAVGPRWLYLLYLVRSWTEPGQILWFSPSSKSWCSFLDNDFQADPLACTELPGRVLKLVFADTVSSLKLGWRDTEEFGFPTHSWLSPLSLQGLFQLHYSWLPREDSNPPFHYLDSQLLYCIYIFHNKPALLVLWIR